VGHHVVIIDDGEGGWKGIGPALQLQSEGHHVEMTTRLPYVGAKLGPFSANLAVPRVHQSGMTTHPFTTVTAVNGPTVQITEQGRPGSITDIHTVIPPGCARPARGA